MARSRIVIVGAGFAGYHAARTLLRLSRGRAEIALVNPMDYFLYLPLLPEVAAGVIDPRRVTVSLPETLPGARLILGEADRIDLDARRLSWVDPEGRRGDCGYDRLVLAVGSVHKLLPIPGVNEHAHGFRGIAEALYLRDHMTRQIELADQDRRRRRARRPHHVRRGRRRLHRHRGRRAGGSVHRRPPRPAPAVARPSPVAAAGPRGADPA